MSQKKSGTILDPRQGGRELVLSTIRANERMARIDIAEHTNISAATVTSITAEMISAGLIEEVARDPENGEMKRGRPRVDLKIRGDSHLIAGIKISQKQASVAILDFEGNSLGEYEQDLPKSQLTQDEMAAFVLDLVRNATVSNGLKLDDISGIGIGLAGIVDAPKGFVHWSPQLSDRNIALRDALQKKIKKPCFIDNDANLVAMAEQWFGYGRKVRDFIVVTIEHGVGMGIVINGSVYRGTRGCGAEFGHTKVQQEGALCRCGQRGCLEAYLGDYALLREANIAATPADDESSRQQLIALLAEAKSGNKTAQSIFDRAGKMFAMGLANIVNIFDPALIILSGERMQMDFLYADDVIDQMRKLVVQVDTPPPEVRIHNWGDLMWARGAAAYAMEGVSELALEALGTQDS